MAADHPIFRHFHDIRQHIRRKHQCDFPELERRVDALEADMRTLLARCPSSDAATITLTVQ